MTGRGSDWVRAKRERDNTENVTCILTQLTSIRSYLSNYALEVNLWLAEYIIHQHIDTLCVLFHSIFLPLCLLT